MDMFTIEYFEEGEEIVTAVAVLEHGTRDKAKKWLSSHIFEEVNLRGVYPIGDLLDVDGHLYTATLS